MKPTSNAILYLLLIVLALWPAISLAEAPQWQPAPSLNLPRQFFGAAVDECGNIWVAGGWNRTSGCPTAEGPVWASIEMLAFDGESYASSWTLLQTEMPMTRVWHTLTIVNRFLYVIGGMDRLHTPPGTPAIAQIDRYDIAKGTWDSSAVPPLNTPRFDHAATVDRFGRIWVVGGIGYSGATRALDSVECFDPARPELGWQIGPTLNVARQRCGSVTDTRGRLYAIGGYDYDPHISSVERLDPCQPQCQWTVLGPELPAPSSCEGGGTTMGADGKIYVVAGCKHGPAYWMERTIRLDPDAVAAGWELWSPLQPARGNSRVILGHDGFIYSIGGDVEWCFSTNSVEKLDTRRPVGDINGDTVVDFGDIDPFVGLLSGP